VHENRKNDNTDTTKYVYIIFFRAHIGYYHLVDISLWGEGKKRKRIKKGGDLIAPRTPGRNRPMLYAHKFLPILKYQISPSRAQGIIVTEHTINK